MELGKQIMTETGILTDASPWISVEPAAWRPLTEGRTPRLFRKKTFLYTQGQPAEHFTSFSRTPAVCVSKIIPSDSYFDVKTSPIGHYKAKSRF